MRPQFPRLFLTSLTVLAALSIPSIDAQTYKVPRTPWGDPDLQGLWPGNMGVPLQRPVEFGDRTTLTDAEFARKEAQAKAQAEADARQFVAPGEAVGIGPPSHWTERG